MCPDTQVIQRTAQWEAHKESISALQWMQHGALPGRGFIMSASSDKGLALWSPAGAHVGNFGQSQQWDPDDTTTWKSTVACPASDTPPTERQIPAVQHEHVQPADLLDAAVRSLMCERSEASDVSSVYSSGDEELPECFKDPDADDRGNARA